MKTKNLEETLNKFGSLKEPFLFVISYDLKKFYAQKLSKLPDTIKYNIDTKTSSKLRFFSNFLTISETVSVIDLRFK